MEILIGMDEAGYGPNFGPLVVAATAWQVRDEAAKCTVHAPTRRVASAATPNIAAKATAQLAERSSHADYIDLYRLLRNIVTKRASERRIAIADSKVLYTPGLGLRQLERGLHAVLLSMRQSLSSWSEIVQYCGADPDGHHKRACWPDNFDCPLPVDAAVEDLVRLEPRFTRACEAAGIRPMFIRARLVFPAEFNDLVLHYGTKGAALSHITVGLLHEVMDNVTNVVSEPPSSNLAASWPQPPIYVLCDKHGGRNYYAALLQHHFSDHWIEPVFESHAESRYEWGPPESRIRVSFRMRGERFLPTALASMTAKYFRELSMRAFNDFWCAQVPNLRPTAGYPKDANRFRKDIQSAQRKLGIDDHLLWRQR